MRRRLVGLAGRGGGTLVLGLGLLVLVPAVVLPLVLSLAGLGRDGVVIGLLVTVVLLLAAVLLATVAAWRGSQVAARRLRSLEQVPGDRPATPAPPAGGRPVTVDELRLEVAELREAMWALVPDLRAELRLYHADLAAAASGNGGDPRDGREPDPAAQLLTGRPAQTVLVLDDGLTAARLAARSVADGRADVVVLAPAAAVGTSGLPDLADVSVVVAPAYPEGSVGEGALTALRAQLDDDVPVITVP